MPTESFYAELCRRCMMVESLLIDEIGAHLYTRLDRGSGFIQAGEYGLWVECLIENLVDDGIEIRASTVLEMRSLLSQMKMDPAKASDIPVKKPARD